MTGFVRCDARLLIRRPVKHFNHLTFIPLLPFIYVFFPSLDHCGTIDSRTVH